MQGFKNTTRMQLGHNPSAAGRAVGQVPRFATGGPVLARDTIDANSGHPDIYPPAGNRIQGNAGPQRKISSTRELEEHGGKGPLTSGFAKGGKTGAKHFHVHKHYHHAKGGRTHSVTHSYGAMEKHAERYAEGGGHIIDDTTPPAGGPDYAKGGRSRKGRSKSAVRKNAGGALYATGGTINKLAGGGLPAMPSGAFRGAAAMPTGALGQLASAPRVPLRHPMVLPGGARPPFVTR